MALLLLHRELHRDLRRGRAATPMPEMLARVELGPLKRIAGARWKSHALAHGPLVVRAPLALLLDCERRGRGPTRSRRARSHASAPTKRRATRLVAELCGWSNIRTRSWASAATLRKGAGPAQRMVRRREGLRAWKLGSGEQARVKSTVGMIW